MIRYRKFNKQCETCTYGETSIINPTLPKGFNLLKYKGYVAIIDNRSLYNNKSYTGYGQIIGIKDLVMFEGDSVETIEREFHKTVNDYIAYCKEIGEEPQVSQIGKCSSSIVCSSHCINFLGRETSYVYCYCYSEAEQDEKECAHYEKIEWN